MVKFSDPSVCRVRVFFLCSERETKEWIEISDELENPAIYDGKLVKFKVRHFSKYVYIRLQKLKVLRNICWGIPRFNRDELWRSKRFSFPSSLLLSLLLLLV